LDLANHRWPSSFSNYPSSSPPSASFFICFDRLTVSLQTTLHAHRLPVITSVFPRRGFEALPPRRSLFALFSDALSKQNLPFHAWCNSAGFMPPPRSWAPSLSFAQRVFTSEIEQTIILYSSSFLCFAQSSEIPSYFFTPFSIPPPQRNSTARDVGGAYAPP